MYKTRHTTVIGTKKGWHGAQRVFAGIAVALLLFNTPLPAFADTASDPAQSTQASQSQSDAPTAPTTNADNLLLGTVGDVTPLALADNSSNTQQSTSNTNNTATNQQSVQNNIEGNATSGNATVADNKKAGSATSGDSSAQASVVNIANSNTNLGGNGNFNFFTQDIGDQTSNVVIDPNALMQAGTINTNQAGGSLQTNASLTDILNNITLAAQSGDATVSGNKKAGDATSGDASALANIINIVSSSISANNSFLGIINIYGNLKGDILVPKSFVDSLVDTGDSLAIPSNNNSNTAIENNITANATSGDATVSGNKKAGNATSGDALSNITVFNLTGQQVVAKNSLLVFVNVLGKWVGMIVPAPGSNSAILGGGVDQSQTGQSGSGSSNDTTTHITNNISVSAQSGDATVSDNKKAGNATSGDAKAGASLVNITNSSFNLGDWFGALFINVLGSWVGDFGIQDDTPATDQPGDDTPTQPIEDVKIFQFDSEAEVAPVSGDDGQQYDDNDISFSTASTVTSNDDHSGHVLGASTSSHNTPDASIATHNVSMDLAALVAIIGALTLLIALGSLALRRRLGQGNSA